VTRTRVNGRKLLERGQIYAETNPNDFTRSQVRRSGIPVRLIALFPAIMALGMLACTSEETPTEPTGSPSQAKAAVGTYVTDLGTLGGTSSAATGINPSSQVVGRSATAGGQGHAFL
jgi:uncharacterized membrane protein